MFNGRKDYLGDCMIANNYRHGLHKKTEVDMNQNVANASVMVQKILSYNSTTSKTFEKFWQQMCRLIKLSIVTIHTTL